MPCPPQVHLRPPPGPKVLQSTQSREPSLKRAACLSQPAGGQAAKKHVSWFGGSLSGGISGATCQAPAVLVAKGPADVPSRSVAAAAAAAGRAAAAAVTATPAAGPVVGGAAASAGVTPAAAATANRATLSSLELALRAVTSASELDSSASDDSRSSVDPDPPDPNNGCMLDLCEEISTRCIMRAAKQAVKDGFYVMQKRHCLRPAPRGLQKRGQRNGSDMILVGSGLVTGFTQSPCKLAILFIALSVCVAVYAGARVLPGA